MKVTYHWPRMGVPPREFDCEDSTDLEFIARKATGHYVHVRMWGNMGDTRESYTVRGIKMSGAGFSCIVGGDVRQTLVCKFSIGGPW